MMVDQVTIAGPNAIPVPDGVQVGDIFTLTVDVHVYAVEKEKVDVSTFGNAAYLPGPLTLKLVAVQR